MVPATARGFRGSAEFFLTPDLCTELKEHSWQCETHTPLRRRKPYRAAGALGGVAAATPSRATSREPRAASQRSRDHLGNLPGDAVVRRGELSTPETVDRERSPHMCVFVLQNLISDPLHWRCWRPGSHLRKTIVPGRNRRARGASRHGRRR